MTVFIEAPDVAGMVGFHSADAFLLNRHRLEDEEGFPLPLPTSRRPLKWRRTEVQAWVDGMGRPKDQLPDATRMGGNVVLLAEARRG